MKVTGYRLAMLRVPLRTPFKTALRQVEQVEDVVLLLESECGKIGYGSAPATMAITGRDHLSILESLKNSLLPWVKQQEFGDLNSLLSLLALAPSYNVNARSALEIAVFDLAAQIENVPLVAYLGGGSMQLSTGITISVGDPKTMVASARSAVERGFTSLKLKVGGNPEEDIARVTQVADVVGSTARLYLDANQAWSSDQAIAVIGALNAQGLSVDLLEQPVAASDLAGLMKVRLALDTPVMADESVFDAHDAARLIELGAADILNIKLVKSAGISDALAIADIAADAQVSCMMGCMLESSIGVSAAAHVAAARSSAIARVDLDAPMLCRQNPVVGGTLFDGPRVQLNASPGLGINSVQGLEFL
ncbi:MAG: dipeptide epimerase [Halioglobus sp.]